MLNTGSLYSTIIIKTSKFITLDSRWFQSSLARVQTIDLHLQHKNGMNYNYLVIARSIVTTIHMQHSIANSFVKL